MLAFEKILEQGLIVNDGSFGYATDPKVRDKMATGCEAYRLPKLSLGKFGR